MVFEVPLGGRQVRGEQVIDSDEGDVVQIRAEFYHRSPSRSAWFWSPLPTPSCRPAITQDAGRDVAPLLATPRTGLKTPLPFAL